MNDRVDALHFKFEVSPLLFDSRPIFGALDESLAQGGLAAIADSVRGKLGELSLSLATREQLLFLCLRKLDAALTTAIEAAKPVDGSERLLPLGSEDVYSLVLYVDSFLFEIFAYKELLEQFFKCALRKVLGIPGRETQSVYEDLCAAGGNVGERTWLAFLADVRHHFTHSATPWLAIDRTRQAEGVYDVVIMHENITDFADADAGTYFRVIADLNQAWMGMRTTARSAHLYLLGAIHELASRAKHEHPR